MSSARGPVGMGDVEWAPREEEEAETGPVGEALRGPLASAWIAGSPPTEADEEVVTGAVGGSGRLWDSGSLASSSFASAGGTSWPACAGRALCGGWSGDRGVEVGSGAEGLTGAAVVLAQADSVPVDTGAAAVVVARGIPAPVGAPPVPLPLLEESQSILLGTSMSWRTAGSSTTTSLAPRASATAAPMASWHRVDALTPRTCAQPLAAFADLPARMVEIEGRIRTGRIPSRNCSDRHCTVLHTLHGTAVQHSFDMSA